MSLNARFVPLARPDKGMSMLPSPFQASYMDTLNLLEREMRMLAAKNIVIQAGFRANQIRNDGWPYSGAQPEHPACVVSFTSPKGELSFPCSRYRKFEANLRAIALALEALRAVDRYGVTRQAEQYRGWAALPAGASEEMTREQAAIWLSCEIDARVDPGPILSDPKMLEFAYNLAARKLHPDRPTGSHEQFVKLGNAIRVLRAAV